MVPNLTRVWISLSNLLDAMRVLTRPDVNKARRPYLDLMAASLRFGFGTFLKNARIYLWGAYRW